MCGIVVVVRRPSERAAPIVGDLEAELGDVLAGLPSHRSVDGLVAAAGRVEEVDRLLKGIPGLRALLGTPTSLARIDGWCGALETEIAAVEAWLDDLSAHTADELEAMNAAVIRLKDAVWAVRRDRLRTATAVSDLAGRDAGAAAIEVMASVQVALSSLDRLEVRGRDSAGLHLMVWDHGVDLDATGRALVDAWRDPLFGSGSVHEQGGVLSFVYKGLLLRHVATDGPARESAGESRTGRRYLLRLPMIRAVGQPDAAQLRCRAVRANTTAKTSTVVPFGSHLEVVLAIPCPPIAARRGRGGFLS